MHLTELIETTVSGLGYELVDLERSGGGMLRVYIDQPAGIAIEDCEKVTRQLQYLLEVENIDYDRLEVSSPGLDRPLTKLADYARFAGEDVQLNLHEMTDGARRWKGTLRGIEGDAVLVETATGIRKFPFAGIDRCRLVPKIEWRKGK